MIKKGQELSTSAKLHGKLMFYWVFRPNTNRIVRITVLASDADVAPLRSTHKVSPLHTPACYYKFKSLECCKTTLTEGSCLVLSVLSSVLPYCRSLHLLCNNIIPSLTSWQSVYKVAELIIDLSSVPKKQFVREKDPHGNFYYKLSYEVHVSVQSSLEFSLVVNGTTYGSVQANYA